MIRVDKNNRTYYVVLYGRRPGIYKNHEQAMAQVHGFPNGQMKKIKGLKEAKGYFERYRQTNSENKIYYVVKVGRKPGLYLDKRQAIEQIRKYPYGKMKRIKGYKNALAYFQGKEAEELEAVPNIYIDGSYMQHNSFSGYGFVVELKGEIVAKDCGVILDYDIINLHSAGAELYAFIRALEWSLANGYTLIRIIYDSNMIAALLDNNYVPKEQDSYGKTKLIHLYDQYKTLLTIQHSHKNEKNIYTSYHQAAHDLSRLLSDVRKVQASKM